MTFNLDAADKWASVVAGAIAVLGVLAAVAGWARRQSSQVRSHRRRARTLPRLSRHRQVVASADLISLGVHRAILPSGSDERDIDFRQPSYIWRDYDSELRATVEAAKRGSSAVLLVGSSSTGKTRSAAEAIKSQLQDWEIVVPLTRESLQSTLANITEWDHVVIWLNELQVFLDDDSESLCALLLKLIDQGKRVLIVGTIWPEYLHEYRMEVSRRKHPVRQSLLDKMKPISIAPHFSSVELERASEAAKQDEQLSAALSGTSGRTGAVTQTLAAGPELLSHWLNAPDVYCRRLMEASFDARMLGALSPLRREQLTEIAWTGLTAEERARATDTSMQRAFAYATEKLRGATGVLTPEEDDSGKVRYILADYVFEYGRRDRSLAVVSQDLWRTMARVIEDAGDLVRLGDAAKRRGAETEAESLYRASMERGNSDAPLLLAELLIGQLRLSPGEAILRQAVDGGVRRAWLQLFRFLRSHGRLAEAELVLRQAIQDDVASFVGQTWKHRPYESRLAQAGSTPRLGSTTAIHISGPETELVKLLVDQGRREEAVEVLRQAVARGKPFFRQELAGFLRGVGSEHDPEAEALLLAATADQEPGARYALASLYTATGRHAEAVALWEEALQLGEPQSALALAEILESQERWAEAKDLLLSAANHGQSQLYIDLALKLERRGERSEATTVLEQALREEVTGARTELARILLTEGRLELARRLLMEAAVDEEADAWKLLVLVDLVVDPSHTRAASLLERRAEFGDPDSIVMLAWLLALDEGEESAMDLLRKSEGILGEERALTPAGIAAWDGQLDRAQEILFQRVEVGVRHATEALIGFLLCRDDPDLVESVWRRAIVAGDFGARQGLAEFLVTKGRITEAEAVLRESLAAGELNSGQMLGRFLFDQGRTDEALEVFRDAHDNGEDTVAGPYFHALLSRSAIEAEAFVEKAASRGTLWNEKQLRAWIELTRGNVELAERYLCEAVERNEHGAAAFLVETLRDQGNSEQILNGVSDRSDQVLEALLASGETTAAKAMALRASSKREDANAKVSRFLLKGDDIGARDVLTFNYWSLRFGSSERLVEFLINRDELDEAEDVAIRAVVVGDFAALVTLARVFRARGDVAGTRRALWAGAALGQRRAVSALKREPAEG